MKIRGLHIFLAAVSVMSMTALVSCLENDIPYARIEVGFTEMTAEGETAAASIDNTNRVVTLTMGEAVDLTRVNITSYKVSDGATIDTDITGGIDLSGDYFKVNVSLYQDYEWLIKATQSIERYFNVTGQVGSSIIDHVGKRVVVNISDEIDLSAVQVGDVKLGPEGLTTMTPDLSNTTVDFANPVEVTVSYRNVTEMWTIYVFGGEVVSLDRVDAWTNVIWLYGSAQEGADNGFEYRRQGDEEWIRVDRSAIINDGGEFSTCVPHLEANTTYEVRAYSGTAYTAAWTTMTEGVKELPNMSFDDWWFENNKIWNPWAEGDQSFWDTGNDGAATFASLGVGGSITTPDEDTWDGGPGYSAKLETDWVVVKLAGGNIFSGEYVRTDGTNGVLNFGREFTGRPTRLRGHWKYNVATIDRSAEDALDYMIGEPDTAIVYMALINSATPIEIRTNPNNRKLFDRNADYVIAYGEVQTGESIEQWSDFDLELKYNRTDAVPTHVIIVGTASKYADYFVGGEGSTLWLDELSLGWDY